MREIIRYDEKRVVLHIEGQNYFLSRNAQPKVIFQLPKNSSGELIEVDYQVQCTCGYPDFIECFEIFSDYLFSAFETLKIEKISVKKPLFHNELFIKDGYEIINNRIIKERFLKERKGI